MSILMHEQALCLVIEKIINKALLLNVYGLEGLIPLEQKTLSIQLAEFSFPISFSIDNQKVLVTSLIERSDCQLTSSISSLIELQKDQQITQLIKQQKLDIIGDIKVAQQFAAIFEELTIDWQSELALHIGDVPTYKLTQLALWFSHKAKFAAHQIQADASEWLVHEKRLLVTKSQLLSFNQQVSKTVDDLLSVERRVERLTTKILNMPDVLNN